MVNDLDQFEELIKTVDEDDDRDSLHANDSLKPALPKLREAHAGFLGSGRAGLEVR